MRTRMRREDEDILRREEKDEDISRSEEENAAVREAVNVRVETRIRKSCACKLTYARGHCAAPVHCQGRGEGVVRIMSHYRGAAVWQVPRQELRANKIAAPAVWDPSVWDPNDRVL